MNKYFVAVKRIQVTLKTGLHIGSGNDDVQIGGVDSSVVKDPITKLPIIPGSSIKGKLRFLLETAPDLPNGEFDDKINLFFGATSDYLRDKNKNASKTADDTLGKQFKESPTRILFRDLFLSDIKTDEDEYSDMQMMYSGELTTEFKSEIKMNRTTGKVDRMGPRTIERVPAGLKFVGEIVIRYSDEQELKEITSMLERSFEMISKDALGGSGSRGYGHVDVKFIV
jgi:CRISPR-associated protein Csm3